MPQNHVDKVCNELVELGESDFEQELGAVIFSHVPDAQRLGCASLDELIGFMNGEKIKRIDTLVSQLKEISRLRAELEAQNDPVFKRALKKQLGQRELELQAHDQAKPLEVPNPADTGAGDEKSKVLLTGLSTVQSQKDVLTKQVEDLNAKLREAARRSAVAGRLIEMLDNFGKEFERFKESLRPDAEELTLKVEDLVTLSIKSSAVEKIRSDSDKQQMTAKTLLEDASPAGLTAQLAGAEAKVADIKSQLDAPNRDYQAYLKSIEEWQKRRSEIVGSGKDPESIEGLKVRLAEVDQLPRRSMSIGRSRWKPLLQCIQRNWGRWRFTKNFINPFSPL